MREKEEEETRSCVIQTQPKKKQEKTMDHESWKILIKSWWRLNAQEQPQTTVSCFYEERMSKIENISEEWEREKILEEWEREKI